MSRSSRAILPEEPQEASAWSAIVLMASSVGAFALISVFLAYNHRWTDALLSVLPAPGPAHHLANDGVLAEQLRISNVRTEHLTLSDRSVALLLEASIVNDSSVPVRGIVLEVEGFRDGKSLGSASGTCGKNVSVRQLKRLSRDEVTALMELTTPGDGTLPSGAAMGCQVTLTQLRTEVDEVSYRIAGAEPTPYHAGPLDGSDPLPH